MKSAVAGTNSALGQQFQVQEKIYFRSRQLGDLITATNALHTMLALQPERSEFNDSLALIYLGRAMFVQAKQLATEILLKKPGNLPVREVLAQATENLGNYNEALAAYELLHSETKNVIYLYKIAAFQYLLKRFGECEVSLQQIESAPDAAASKVVLNYPGETPNFQRVPVIAAALNIRGVIAKDMNLPEEAGKSFNQALQIMPDFIMAQRNLQRLSEK